MTEKRKCPACFGAKKCTMCRGTGKLGEEDCKICDGTGKCYTCKGRGVESRGWFSWMQR